MKKKQHQLADSERTFSGKSAIVIGGSLAGLLAARALSNHFDQVTILEKDAINDVPESRRGQPQTRHAHGLLAYGLEILEAYFPGLTEELAGEGAIKADMGQAIRWHQFGGYRRQFKSGLEGIVVSRPVLEWKIRQRILVLDNVAIRSGVRVEKLVPNSQLNRVTGLMVRDSQNGDSLQGLVADLFVDASGRGSRTPRWLVELGFVAPPKEEARVDLSYVSRIYRRRQSDHLKGELAMILPSSPDEKRMAFLLPMEDDRWIVTLGGWHGQDMPADDRSMVRYLRELPAPDIFHVIRDAEPLSDIFVHKFPGSRRRRFERLERFPEGYLVMGDALASFTPIYGQGMTSAAMQAEVLDSLLSSCSELTGLWEPYFKNLAGLIDKIWQLAVSEDFRFQETTGKKPRAVGLISWYIGRVHTATHRDTVVYAQFLQVMNLLAPATSLFQPRILARVIADGLRAVSAGITTRRSHQKVKPSAAAVSS